MMRKLKCLYTPLAAGYLLHLPYGGFELLNSHSANFNFWIYILIKIYYYKQMNSNYIQQGTKEAAH